MANRTHKLRGKIPVAAVVAFVGGLALIFFWRVNVDDDDAIDAMDLGTVHEPRSLTRDVNWPSPATSDPMIASSIVQAITSAQNNLNAVASPPEKLRILQALLDSLKSNPHRAEVVAALIGYLRSQNGDAATGFAFAVGPDGSLQMSPSLRVALLDLLGQADRSSAQQFAEEIFKSSNSPDEWAVALRDCGRGLDKSSVDRKTQFADRVAHLLSHEEWLRVPTAGFLHAFDAAVSVGGADTARRMISIHDGAYHPATSYAARLSLDRLAIVDFRLVAEAIQEDPVHMSQEPEARAAILARGDPSDAGDVKLMHDYLVNESIGVAERQVFLRHFPNGNLELSNNLLTHTILIPMATMADRDEAASRLLLEWAADPMMASLRDDLNARRIALGTYAGARERGQ